MNSDAELDRLLGGKPDLSVTEREALLGAVLDRAQPRPRRSARWLIGGFAAVAAVALAAVVVVPDPQPDLTPRGGAITPSLTLSCLVDGRVAPCARGAKLVFELAPAGHSAFAAVAEAPDGSTLWLFP